MDGNKRTLLLATKSYLKLNGYLSLFPLRILRYIIGIAGTMSEEQDVTDSMIIQISNWIKLYVAKADNSTQMVNVMNKFYSDFKYIGE